MVNVAKFVKNNIPLCICSLGLAVLGYLGYHAVQWIISKCSKTEKIDLIAQKTIGYLSPHEVFSGSNNRINPQILPLTKTSRQELRKGKLEQQKISATKIQSIFRRYKARLMFTKQFHCVFCG